MSNDMLRDALEVIANIPIKEQDNLVAENMRKVAEEALAISNPESQSQAGETRATAWVSMQFGIPYQATTDEPTAIRWRKAGGDVVDHISLQSHREAMAEQERKYRVQEAALHAMDHNADEKDAALQACVTAIQNYRKPMHLRTAQEEDEAGEALTQAQRALK